MNDASKSLSSPPFTASANSTTPAIAGVTRTMPLGHGMTMDLPATSTVTTPSSPTVSTNGLTGSPKKTAVSRSADSNVLPLLSDCRGSHLQSLLSRPRRLLQSGNRRKQSHSLDCESGSTAGTSEVQNKTPISILALKGVRIGQVVPPDSSRERRPLSRRTCYSTAAVDPLFWSSRSLSDLPTPESQNSDGQAMNSVLYVPTTTPMRRMNEKLRRLAPPPM